MGNTCSSLCGGDEYKENYERSSSTTKKKTKKSKKGKSDSDLPQYEIKANTRHWKSANDIIAAFNEEESKEPTNNNEPIIPRRQNPCKSIELPELTHKISTDREKPYTFLFDSKAYNSLSKKLDSKVKEIFKIHGRFKSKEGDMPSEIEISKLVLKDPFSRSGTTEVYYGHWNSETGAREGSCIWIMSSGNLFEGFLVNNKCKGYGRLIKTSGSIHQGQFFENALCGEGIKIDKEAGVTYQGKWKDGLLQGKGYEENTQQEYTKYEGDFKKGEKTGNGKFEFVNGDKYEGQVVKGIRHGQGIYTWTDGSVYVGEFDRGLMHGKGAKQFSDGAYYIGMYENGCEHGQGTMYFPDGSSHEGQWEDGKQHGPGVYQSKDGNIQKGEWIEGELTTLS